MTAGSMSTPWSNRVDRWRDPRWDKRGGPGPRLGTGDPGISTMLEELEVVVPPCTYVESLAGRSLALAGWRGWSPEPLGLAGSPSDLWVDLAHMSAPGPVADEMLDNLVWYVDWARTRGRVEPDSFRRQMDAGGSVLVRRIGGIEDLWEVRAALEDRLVEATLDEWVPAATCVERFGASLFLDSLTNGQSVWWEGDDWSRRFWWAASDGLQWP